MEEWLLLQPSAWLYVTIFLALIGGVFGLPIPEDLPLIAAGVLIKKGRADLLIMGVICYSAVIFGDIIIYRIGSKLGPALFTRRWFRRRVSLSQIKKMRANLDKRSFLMIFIARHLFYLRTVTFLACGALKMSFVRFLISDLIAGLISLPIMIGIGYLGAEHLDLLIQEISTIKRGVFYISAPLIILAVIFYYRYRKANQIDSEDPSLVDLVDDETEKSQ
jgi:membrane protein DedA with SNARE-associated domain